MKDLRVSRLIQALPLNDITFIKNHLKKQSNKFYFPLFIAFDHLKSKELTREEIYLRVYKKKWNTKLDTNFRIDINRLTDFIENALIQNRLEHKIKNDRSLFESEKLSFYTDLKLDKETQQQYQFIINDESINATLKNTSTKNFAEYIIGNTLALKDKVLATEKLILDYNLNSKITTEIQQSEFWFLKCMHNYYYKQNNNVYFENIDVDALLQLSDNFTNIEAKFNILNGIAYLKIDSHPKDIDIKIYENALQYAKQLTSQNEENKYKELKALHLIGTRYSILGSFEKGNFYFEEAIQILANEQYKNYKTIILNYATNCSKLKLFDKALSLISLLDNAASKDYKLKIECTIRSLSCYLFMENATEINKLVSSEDYNLIQPHEKIYFRLCQCNALLMQNEFELANSEINNLLRSKLMKEIDADFLPVTQLMSFLITAVFKNGTIKLNTQQLIAFEQLKIKIDIHKYPYLNHYSPYMWLEQKLFKMK